MRLLVLCNLNTPFFRHICDNQHEIPPHSFGACELVQWILTCPTPKFQERPALHSIIDPFTAASTNRRSSRALSLGLLHLHSSVKSHLGTHSVFPPVPVVFSVAALCGTLHSKQVRSPSFHRPEFIIQTSSAHADVTPLFSSVSYHQLEPGCPLDVSTTTCHLNSAIMYILACRS